MTFDQGADKQQISRRVVDLVHRHQKPNAPAMTANKACHRTIDVWLHLSSADEKSSDKNALILPEVAIPFGDFHQVGMCYIPI